MVGHAVLGLLAVMLLLTAVGVALVGGGDAALCDPVALGASVWLSECWCVSWRVGAAFGNGVAIGDTLGNSGALGDQRGKSNGGRRCIV